MAKIKRELPEPCPAPYASIFIPVCSSKAFIGASSNAKAFLFALMQQHNGQNNGHLHLVNKWLAKKGWSSASQNKKMRDELIQRGLVVQTRQGGLNADCSWYALTWLPISNATGLDISLATYNTDHRGGWAKCELPDTPRRKAPQKKRDAPSDQRNSAVPTGGTATTSTVPTSGTGNALLSSFAVPTSGNNSLPPLPDNKQHKQQRRNKPIVGKAGHILFLVPSIALLSQSLLEWAAETELPMHCFAVCSDTAVGKSSDTEDIRLHDLPFPATTNARKLATQVNAFSGKKPLTVIFSTYQSIQTIADAQKHGAPAFDLIICDEAHRTTGVTLEGDDESHFVKVHDAKFIKASKRLYMTATPRIFSDGSKTKADEGDATICSMDNEALYGKELHRLGFGEAVGNGLLADYKVMVLAVDEKFVSKTFQKQLAVEGELNLDDVVKITGCWNGLSKRMAKQIEGSDMENDPAPMHRAVAFSRSIKDSKRLTELFAGIVEKYTEQAPEEENLLSCAVDHVDGTMNALKRSNKLDWLKADTSAEGNVCRILSNARCLSEGVDVPALDAVMFLNPRNSVVDVVQSVGRVMRIAPGKKYGYIILPIGIPADVPPEEALKDNQKYKVVWQVLQALRAHDDRFNATINKIELNKKTPDNVQVIGVSGGFDDGEDGQPATGQITPVQIKFDFPNLDEWRDAIFAKIVMKCGDRRYWESWAKDVAQIAERHITRIKALLEGANNAHRKAFDDFLKGLRTNLNPAVSEDDAIEMLAQHLITKPVFDALFEGYEFTRHNPVSQSMQSMLDLLEKQALEREQQPLEKFYASVRQRAGGIDNAQGKQKVIVELYDKFFRTAFPRMAERLGIVYTPVEVVDFIIQSADHALRQEFGVG